MDDINCIFVDWPDPFVTKLYKILEKTLETHGLPVKRTKSLLLREVEDERITFIGWEWNLRAGNLRPSPSKLHATAHEADTLLAQTDIAHAPLRRKLGKLIWTALGLRPLLSVPSHVFTLVELNDPDTTSAGPSRGVLMAAMKEVKLLRTLCPLTQVIVYRPTWTTVVAFDAS